MENNQNEPPVGFKRGINQVYNTRSAADYDRCLKEVSDACTTTESRCNSRSSYYNKMNGRTPLSVAETERLNEIFARYGVTDWQGNE